MRKEGNLAQVANIKSYIHRVRKCAAVRPNATPYAEVVLSVDDHFEQDCMS